MKTLFAVTEWVVRMWPGLLNWRPAHGAFNRIFAIYALQVAKAEAV